jgi:uncharacterized protein with von Willebrand factor type A (vWA) domain
MVSDTLPHPVMFETLETPLAPLERLARRLWLGGLTNSQGQLESRLAGLEQWRDALLAGRLPGDGAVLWPDTLCSDLLCARFRELDLPAWCARNVELTDTVLQSLLFHLDLIVDYVDRGASQAQAVTMALDAFAADWSARCGDMRALVDIFGDLGDLLKNVRWDMLHGLLRSSGWQEVVRIREQIARLPELARIIRQLGRVQRVQDVATPSPARVQATEPTMALHEIRRAVKVPDMPGETRGIHRSQRIARMLPAETMMLAHPRLRLVWHARRAERTLLTYEDDDRICEIRPECGPVMRAMRANPRAERLERGPMLICVDTSGSMQGGAETVAKAVVLEAVRAAHAQRRACHVFAFSGPDEVVDMALTLDADGLERLTRFLGQSFCGGTDIGAPLECAIARLEQEDWRMADLLIASDGEFGATPALAQRLERVRLETGLRVQGVLIGDRETIGMLELADDIHWVRDWRRFGGSDSPSPVHSMSLTANYFPGALRTPENRNATLSGAEASQAVRAGRRSRN